jgi:hypothetical protein
MIGSVMDYAHLSNNKKSSPLKHEVSEASTLKRKSILINEQIDNENID